MPSYHDQLKSLAESIGSDGCTKALDICIECCWEHDWTYVTGLTPQGVSVTKEYADRRFRDCIQSHMSLRWFSPISWVRYGFVKRLGRGIWGKKIVRVLNIINDVEYNTRLLREAQSSRLRIINGN